MPASRAPALGEPSRGLSRRQPGDGSRWDGALAARRRGGGEASLAGCARQRERPAGILPATAAASCDSRPSRCSDFLLCPPKVSTTECFDSTLGFPGEGPTLVFLSNNIRGGLTGNAWWDAISAARGEKADIIGFQEINIQKDDPRLGSLATSALNLGYTAYFAPIPKGGTRGGTAILVKTSLQISKTTFNYIAKGGISWVNLAFSDG